MNHNAEPDIEPLLRQLLQRDWMLVCCGRRDQPDALAAVHRTQCFADVVVLRGHDRAAAYRTLTRPQDDPFQATQVVWHYLSDAERTLCAVLTIPPEAAASKPYPIPQECRIPEAQRRPLTIRLGPPGAFVTSSAGSAALDLPALSTLPAVTLDAAAAARMGPLAHDRAVGDRTPTPVVLRAAQPERES